MMIVLLLLAISVAYVAALGTAAVREQLEVSEVEVSLSGAAPSAPQVRSTAASGAMVYESDRAVHEYLLTHYGNEAEQMPFDFGPKHATGFPRRSAEICSRFANRSTTQRSLRALDVGCAVGGQSFQLANYFDEVVGIDFSRHFVDAANEMKRIGQKEYNILRQGKIFETFVARVDDQIDRSKVSFYQGDACNMDQSLGMFDVILASNLLCRLPKPREFLRSVPSFLSEDGYLVLISPFSWLEEYTAPSEWFGGRMDGNGKEVDSSEEIRAFMDENLPEMSFVSREQVPFLIREHERKYQYGVSECSIWRKK